MTHQEETSIRFGTIAHSISLFISVFHQLAESGEKESVVMRLVSLSESEKVCNKENGTRRV